MSRLLATFLAVLLLAFIGSGCAPGAPPPNHNPEGKTFSFSDANRDYMIRYAYERGIPVLEAYQDLIDSVSLATAESGFETEFSVIAVVHAMRSRNDKGVTAVAAWNQVFDVLNVHGLATGGILTEIESSDDENSGNSCSCQCDVYYRGSCGSDDCEICAECCDNSCRTKCGASTGCGDCFAEDEDLVN